MKNREKYAEELLNVACAGKRAAIDKQTMQIRGCEGLSCGNCLFSCGDCDTKLAEWAESEYVEPVKISKRDRTFLDYIEGYKYIARDGDGELYVYITKPKKGYGIGQMLVSKVLQDWILIYRWSNGQMMNRGRLRI